MSYSDLSSQSAADTYSCIPATEPSVVSIVVKIQVVRVYSLRLEEPPIEHDGPEDEQRRRGHQSEKSCFRAPAKKEAIPPRRGNEHYKQNNMEEECLKIIRLSPVAWQHINLIGIYEFYNDQECLNLHELIEKLVNNKKIDLLAAA